MIPLVATILKHLPLLLKTLNLTLLYPGFKTLHWAPMPNMWNVRIPLSTYKIHISFIRISLSLILMSMGHIGSLVSYEISFTSFGHVVCEIHLNYWTYVWYDAKILLSTSKIHISFIWTALSFILVFMWCIKSLFSYKTSSSQLDLWFPHSDLSNQAPLYFSFFERVSWFLQTAVIPTYSNLSGIFS